MLLRPAAGAAAPAAASHMDVVDVELATLERRPLAPSVSAKGRLVGRGVADMKASWPARCWPPSGPRWAVCRCGWRSPPTRRSAAGGGAAWLPAVAAMSRFRPRLTRGRADRDAARHPHKASWRFGRASRGTPAHSALAPLGQNAGRRRTADVGLRRRGRRLAGRASDDASRCPTRRSGWARSGRSRARHRADSCSFKVEMRNLLATIRSGLRRWLDEASGGRLPRWRAGRATRRSRARAGEGLTWAPRAGSGGRPWGRGSRCAARATPPTPAAPTSRRRSSSWSAAWRSSVLAGSTPYPSSQADGD